MSFLTERITRQVVTTLPRVAIAAPVYAPRAFSTSLAREKTPTESVKDGLKTVDRTVSDKLVDGINVADAARGKAKQSAEEIRQENAAKASQLKGEAKGAAAELKGKAEGAAEKAKQKM